MPHALTLSVWALLAATVGAAPDADFEWVGQRVMLKESATPQVGSRKLEWSSVPMPAAVDKVNGQWLWLGSAWVKQDQVVLLDDAPDYYSQLIGRGDAANRLVGYALRGVAWLAKREYDNAIKDLSEGIRLAPNNSSFFTMRGKAYYGKHLYDAALADFTEAIRLDPGNLVAYNDRGTTWSAKGEYPKAFQQFNEVLRRAPTNALAFANRGTNWFKQDEYDKALADLDRSIKLDPKQSFAYANRGRVYMKLGDYPEAMADYDKAIAMAPHDWPAYNGRARILATAPDFAYHLRDGKQAVQTAKKACELSDWSEWICLATLAAAYAETGDFESAVEWQTKAMEMSQPAEPRDQRENEHRMALYKDGKPYHEAVAARRSEDASDDSQPKD